jgi:hypothetical protein
MKEILIAGILFGTSFLSGPSGEGSLRSVLGGNTPDGILARESLDLTKRVPDPVVTRIFADNILLNLHYMKGDISDVSYEPRKGEVRTILWDKVREPFSFSIKISPGEVFSFHDIVLPEFEGRKFKTGWTQFSRVEGYKIFDGLWGNGVCHLATLINWVSTEAGLKVTARVNHDFFLVPGVDRRYGTSIVYIPESYTTKLQNLYVDNPFSFPVVFEFEANADRVNLSVIKDL